MNIIQSYYQISNNHNYYSKHENDNYMLNFYSFLLSYITLKEIYGKVTMYCNHTAYDKFIKYIPYDDLNIIDISDVSYGEYGKEWALLKLHTLTLQEEPFIHVDGDVFIFKDLFNDFINNKKYDLIIQSIEHDLSTYNIYNDFHVYNKLKLMEYKYIPHNYDEISYNKFNGVVAYNNGVLGFRDLEYMHNYINKSIMLNKQINEKIFSKCINNSLIFEQLNLYNTTLMNKKNAYEVIPYSMIQSDGISDAANKLGYTHLLGGNKYVDYFIMLIRKKIKNKYNKYYKHILDFEKNIEKYNIKYYKHTNIINHMSLK